MKTGEKKRLLGGIKKSKAMWEKWYEATTEEETTASTYKIHAFWWQLLATKKTHTFAYRDCKLPRSGDSGGTGAS